MVFTKPVFNYLFSQSYFQYDDLKCYLYFYLQIERQTHVKNDIMLLVS